MNAIAGEKNSLFCAAGKPSVDHIGLQLQEILVPARREGKEDEYCLITMITTESVSYS